VDHVHALAQGDEARSVFRFPPLVAPIKATVFPLLQKQELSDVARKLSSSLTSLGLSNIVDTTGTSIGVCAHKFAGRWAAVRAGSCPGGKGGVGGVAGLRVSCAHNQIRVAKRGVACLYMHTLQACICACPHLYLPGDQARRG